MRDNELRKLLNQLQTQLRGPYVDNDNGRPFDEYEFEGELESSLDDTQSKIEAHFAAREREAVRAALNQLLDVAMEIIDPLDYGEPGWVVRKDAIDRAIAQLTQAESQLTPEEGK